MKILMILSAIAMIVMLALYRLMKVKGALHRMFLYLACFFGVIILAALVKNAYFLLIEMPFVIAIFADFKLEKRRLRNN